MGWKVSEHPPSKRWQGHGGDLCTDRNSCICRVELAKRGTDESQGPRHLLGVMVSDGVCGMSRSLKGK